MLSETPLDDKTLEILELPLVLERLARLTAFSAGREAALRLGLSEHGRGLVERALAGP